MRDASIRWARVNHAQNRVDWRLYVSIGMVVCRNESSQWANEGER